MDGLNVNLILCDKITTGEKTVLSGIFDKLYIIDGYHAEFYIYMICTQFTTIDELKKRELSLRIRFNKDERGNHKSSYLELKRISFPSEEKPIHLNENPVNVELSKKESFLLGHNYIVHVKTKLQGFGNYQIEVADISNSDTEAKIITALPFELCRKEINGKIIEITAGKAN